MIRHFWTTFFLCFSFLIITAGGYKCARPAVPYIPVTPPVILGGGLNEGDGNIDEEGSASTDGDNNYAGSLPPEPSDRCNRRVQRDLQDRFGGGVAFIKLNRANLEDYLLGRAINFELQCPRIIVSLARSKRSYKGRLHISYQSTGSSGTVVKVQSYDTGKSESDTQYNDWKGNWNRTDRHGVVKPRFIALFEDKNFGAVVLHINKVIAYEVVDGEISYRGYGDIWFKPFRTYTSRKDVCYSEGTYVSKARNKPPASSRRCWNNSIGPYSCLPDGINTMSQAEKKFKPDQRELDLECYQYLGEFGNLNIRDAFNLNSVDDVKRDLK